MTRLLRIAGRTMFVGVGGLVVFPFIAGMDRAAGQAVAWETIAWSSICAVWVVAGVYARRPRKATR